MTEHIKITQESMFPINEYYWRDENEVLTAILEMHQPPLIKDKGTGEEIVGTLPGIEESVNCRLGAIGFGVAWGHAATIGQSLMNLIPMMNPGTLGVNAILESSQLVAGLAHQRELPWTVLYHHNVDVSQTKVISLHSEKEDAELAYEAIVGRIGDADLSGLILEDDDVPLFSPIPEGVNILVIHFPSSRWLEGHPSPN